MNNLQPINDISSKAFDELFARFQKLDLKMLMTSLIDEVEVSALPHLAEQFHITGNEGWINCQTEQEKRDLIKNSIKLHKYRGTKYALIKVLDVLGLNGKISEWFEYGGRPYYFKLSVDMIERSFDLTTETQLLELIEENKNVRSKLEQILVTLINNTTQRFATYAITNEELTV